MSKRKTTSGPTKHEAELQRFVAWTRELGSTVRHVVQWGVIAAMGYWGYRSIQELAGQITVADIAGSLSWSDCPFFEVASASIFFGLLGIWYGKRQRDLRKTTISRLHWYQEQYERSIDPNRSSSNLTKRGDTRPEDL